MDKHDFRPTMHAFYKWERPPNTSGIVALCYFQQHEVDKIATVNIIDSTIETTCTRCLALLEARSWT